MTTALTAGGMMEALISYSEFQSSFANPVMKD